MYVIARNEAISLTHKFMDCRANARNDNSKLDRQNSNDEIEDFSWNIYDFFNSYS